jgi:anti-sigma factor RsiW
MSDHLSPEQFARCFVEAPTNEERQHLVECAACSAEFNAFGNSVSSLRLAIRGQVDARVESKPAAAIPVAIRPVTQGMRKLRWALATAAVLLIGIVPLVTSRKPEPVTQQIPATTSPDDLMNAINAHLSRTVPAPMEPMMSLIPSDESSTE